MTSSPLVVVPVCREVATAFDSISLTHLRTHLCGHEIAFIGPSGLSRYWTEYEFVDFPDQFFRSRHSYNELMLSEGFYRRFENFSHILIYQLDALVFRDELAHWCDRPYDYLGATFYRDLIERADNYSWPYARIACCNGGFSLRRVDAFLVHLTERRSTLAAACSCLARCDLRAASLLLRYRMHLGPMRYKPHESLNEDVYFGLFSKMIKPSLRTPPPDESDRFAFENLPQELIRRAGGILPFGCHAWYKSRDSLDFWRPHLLGDIRDLTL
jgi:hypothetical protein